MTADRDLGLSAGEREAMMSRPDRAFQNKEGQVIHVHTDKRGVTRWAEVAGGNFGARGGVIFTPNRIAWAVGMEGFKTPIEVKPKLQTPH